jgi:hypothetical protein
MVPNQFRFHLCNSAFHRFYRQRVIGCQHGDPCSLHERGKVAYVLPDLGTAVQDFSQTRQGGCITGLGALDEGLQLHADGRFRGSI